MNGSNQSHNKVTRLITNLLFKKKLKTLTLWPLLSSKNIRILLVICRKVNRIWTQKSSNHLRLSVTFVWTRPSHPWLPNVAICTAGHVYINGFSNLKQPWCVQCARVALVKIIWYLFTLKAIVTTHERKTLPYQVDPKDKEASPNRTKTIRTRMEYLVLATNHSLWWVWVYFHLCSRLILLGIILELMLTWLMQTQQIMKKLENNKCNDC